MTLSRTARILVAILLLAAAAFFWVNFFYQDGTAPGDLADGATPGTPATGGASAPSGPVAVEGDAPSAGEAETAEGQPGAAPSVAEPVDTGAPTVVVPTAPDVVTRDVSIAELPFLVTEPPTAADVEGEAAEGDTAAAAASSRAGRRASVNPFSPIVIQAAAPAQQAPSAQTGTTLQPTVLEVDVPQQQPAVTAMREPVDVPEPRPVAPPSPRAAAFPRQLPTGQPLGLAADLLREPRTVPEFIASELGDLAAVREPGATPPASSLPGVPRDVRADDPDAEPLGPGRSATARDQAQAPMQAGTNQLARYLRDNNVVFTGSVLGPVSVGVFRSAATPVPVVVSLGQTLPDTQIVLTDLTGLKAELSWAESTEVLSLDLRR